jgi:small subunit ribosomal protein S20
MAKRIRSAVKKHRQSLKRRARNISVRSTLKTLVKKLNAAVEARDLSKSQEALRVAISAFDKAASKGIIHKGTASRNISRLSKKVYELSRQIEQPSA